MLADLSWPSFKVQFNICQTGVARNFRPAMTLGSSLLPGCSPRRRTLARSSADSDFSVTPAMTQDARPFAFRTAAPHAVTDAVFKSVFQTFLRYRTFGTDVLSFRHAHSVAGRRWPGHSVCTSHDSSTPYSSCRSPLDTARCGALLFVAVDCHLPRLLGDIQIARLANTGPLRFSQHLPPSHFHHLLIEDTPRRL